MEHQPAPPAPAHPSGQMATHWQYRPDVPIRVSPFFTRPLSFARMMSWLAARWVTLGENTVLVGLAVLTWVYLHPPLEEVRTFQWNWVGEMYLRNLILMCVVAGGLHLYFFTFKKQGEVRKFDARALRHQARAFTFNNQVYDNMFWSLASGVTFWTAYEAGMLWAMANGHILMLTWDDSPLLFVLLILLTPVWISFHFYWVHRWMHWPPVYRHVHALHHRNVNVGPWSGLSMHPLEHVIFFSSVLIHCLLAAHPIHIIFHMQHQALTAATSHTGFEGIVFKGRNWFPLGTFHHQLHHRYFECNYGNLEVPADLWHGSFHDGTDEGHAAMTARRKADGHANA